LPHVLSVLLFVYGSLKRGEQHHAELASARFVGEAQTTRGYALTDLGSYRALVEVPSPANTSGDGSQSGVVEGELFEVPGALIPELDDFEGPDYERREVALISAHSRGFSQALAYFLKAR
jgi:gamma-glutamylcyclotransferase (GGCT)/AIG2-like uncharacterized protein YtfP